MWLIKYYKNPCFVLIIAILNHNLWLKNILHPLIWVSIRLHLSLWISSSVIVPFMKTHQSIFHTLPLLVVKKHVSYRSFLYYQNSFVQHQISIRGFYNSSTLLSIFNILFYLSFSDLTICLQVQLSL
jgi:hypothetical protein